MPLAVIVDWYGPYENFSDFKQELKLWDKGTRSLYMALGKRNVVKYIGLTESPKSRPDNHKLKTIAGLTYFAGEIVTQGISGRRNSKRAPDLDAAEHALICYFQPELNVRRGARFPDDCVSIYSRFFSPKDGETPVNALPKFPPHIGWNSWTNEFD